MFHAQEKGDLKVIGTVTASHVARCRSCKAALGVEPNESSSWRDAMEAYSQTATNDPSFRDCLCGVLRSECWGERCLLHRLSQEVRVQDGQVATLAG